MITQSFDEDLARSHKAAALPFWEDVYKQAFPGFKSMSYHPEDGPLQRAGVDRIVTIAGKGELMIDEKTRYENPITKQTFTDIALEYFSCAEKKTDGWIRKELACHFIAYAILPLGQCYLMPTEALQAAWRKHEEEWLREREIIKVRNARYTSESVCIPASVIFGAVPGTLSVSFPAVRGFRES